jgi:hypothetical protein
MLNPRLSARTGPLAFPVLLALSLTCWPPVSHAYSDNPPDGRTGAPGEGTCHDCHSSFPLNSGNGGLTLLGPESFHAGGSYYITVVLSDPGQVRWGFECSPLVVGTCTITDPVNTQLSLFQGKSYVKHTLAGNFTGNPGPVSWTFRWNAPVLNPPAEVVFYAAGNAANNSGTSSGDYIYTTSFTSHYVATDVEEEIPGSPTAGLSAWPNPFSVGTLISFDLEAASEVSLSVFDPCGRSVAELVRGWMPGGRQVAHWDGCTSDGARAAAGVYLCRLHTSAGQQFHRLVVLQ